MNLRLILLGVEVLRITTNDDEEQADDEYDGSGYTATTPIGYAPTTPVGWDNPLHQHGWDE